MRYKLSDLFELQMGKTPSRNNPNYWNSNDYSWVSISDMSSYDKYVSGTKEYISEQAVKESGIKTIPANTVIMSFKLSIGKTAITTGPIFSNEAIMAFIDKKTTAIDPEYIFYLFSGKDWDEGSNKAVMGKTLNKATLSNIEVDIPSLDIQKERIEKLNKISILISDKKQQLNQLDELIKARFVEMFGAYNSNCCSKRIGDYAQILGGYAFKSDEFIQDAVPVIRISNINEGQVVPDYSTCYKETFWENNPKYRALFGDILMAMSGATTGKAGILRSSMKLLVNQRVACIRAKEGVSTSEYIYAVTQMPWMYDLIQEQSAGCAQPNISSKQIENMPIPEATYGQQKEFSAFVVQVDKSKFALSNELAMGDFYVRLVHDCIMHGRIDL